MCEFKVGDLSNIIKSFFPISVLAFLILELFTNQIQYFLYIILYDLYNYLESLSTVIFITSPLS